MDLIVSTRCTQDALSFAISAKASSEISVDLGELLDSLDHEERANLVALVAETTGSTNILEAFEDKASTPIKGVHQLTHRGTILLDVFVERAAKIGRLPDDWEPQWVIDLRGDMDRLQRLIVEGRADDALDLLRDIAPHHDFLSPAAEKMLAGLHSTQGTLAL